MCEECILVFDDPTITNGNQENEKHSRIRKDRISSNRALFLLLISNLIILSEHSSQTIIKIRSACIEILP